MTRLATLFCIAAVLISEPAHAGDDLVRAIFDRDPAAVARAIAAGADVNEKTEPGQTPMLILAVISGGWACVEQLIKGGADLSGRDTDGATALHWAAMNGDIRNVRALLKAGADINSTTYDGFTPLDAGALKKQWHIAGLLRDMGATSSLSGVVEGRQFRYKLISPDAVSEESLRRGILKSIGTSLKFQGFYPNAPGNLASQTGRCESVFDLAVAIQDARAIDFSGTTFSVDARVHVENKLDESVSSATLDRCLSVSKLVTAGQAASITLAPGEAIVIEGQFIMTAGIDFER